MSFITGLIRGFAIFLAIGTAISAASPGFAQTTKAQGKSKALAPSPAAEPAPSNVDLVNKALNPGASDPDVPLPHPDLARANGNGAGSSSKPQIYGRQEDGGGVLGLRLPIPADRGVIR